MDQKVNDSELKHNSRTPVRCGTTGYAHHRRPDSPHHGKTVRVTPRNPADGFQLDQKRTVRGPRRRLQRRFRVRPRGCHPRRRVCPPFRPLRCRRPLVATPLESLAADETACCPPERDQRHLQLLAQRPPAGVHHRCQPPDPVRRSRQPQRHPDQLQRDVVHLWPLHPHQWRRYCYTIPPRASSSAPPSPSPKAPGL